MRWENLHCAAKTIFQSLISTFHTMKHARQNLKFTFHIMMSSKECGLTILVDCFLPYL